MEYELSDLELDYTAEVDEVAVDNSLDVISEPEEEYSESFSDYLSEEPMAVTSPSSILPTVAKQEAAFQSLQSTTPSVSPATAAAISTAAAAITANKVEEKKPFYKNPLVIGAGLLAVLYMMNDD